MHICIHCEGKSSSFFLHFDRVETGENPRDRFTRDGDYTAYQPCNWLDTCYQRYFFPKYCLPFFFLKDTWHISLLTCNNNESDSKSTGLFPSDIPPLSVDLHTYPVFGSFFLSLYSSLTLLFASGRQIICKQVCCLLITILFEKHEKSLTDKIRSKSFCCVQRIETTNREREPKVLLPCREIEQ